LSKGTERKGPRSEARVGRRAGAASGGRPGGIGVARIGIPNDWREIVEALARVPAAP
jgi:hypothetical protein